MYLLPRGVWVHALPVHVLLRKVKMLSRSCPSCARCSVVFIKSFSTSHLISVFSVTKNHQDSNTIPEILPSSLLCGLVLSPISGKFSLRFCFAIFTSEMQTVDHKYKFKSDDARKIKFTQFRCNGLCVHLKMYCKRM